MRTSEVSTASNFNLLLVEDNPGDADLAREHLSSVPGYRCPIAHVSTLGAAIEAITKIRYDAVLLDLSLPDSTGIQTLETLRKASGEVAIIVLSGSDGEEIRDAAMCAGAMDFIWKGESQALLLARGILYALDRYRAEEEHSQVRKLVASNPDAVIVSNPQGVVRFVNDSALRLFGRTKEGFLGQQLDFVLAPGAKTVIEIVSAPEKRTAEVHVVDFEWQHEPALLASIRDITERCLLADQLRQAQKMEAIGKFSAGIAHDFNNLLNVIMGYTDLLTLSSESADPEVLDSLNEIRHASARAADLTRQLLAFGRKSIVAPAPLNLNACIEKTERMLRRLIGESIRLVTILDPSLGNVFADAGQIEQVILNIIANARDAMPAGGTVTLETQNVRIDQGAPEHFANPSPGWYVCMTISDDGIGMDEETQCHVFEPFYTTKEPGRGTGLGLSTVYGIVEQAGGHVSVHSKLGSGTTFKLIFPMIDPIAPQKSDQAETLAQCVTGTETILLVEDESGVRDLTSKVLRINGYTVLVATNGLDALEISHGHEGEIHLVLTDVVMPQMGGTQLVAALSQVRPNIKVLYMSGYTDDALLRQGILKTPHMLLQKPFTLSALAKRVRDLLDR